MKQLLLAALVALTIFNLGFGIDRQQVAKWDEARHIASAMEMLESRDFIVTRYMHDIDYWNLKPPVSIWFTALGCCLFQDKFLGARAPSLFAAAIVLLLTFLHARRLAGTSAGLVAALLVISSSYLVTLHGLRTADPDVFLMVATSGGMLLLSWKTRLGLTLCYLSLGVAFLVKSFHAVPFSAAVAIYSLYLWRRQALKWFDVVLTPLAALVPIVPWALARWHADGSQFFEAMFLYDVVKRSTEVVESHHSNPFLYVGKIAEVSWAPALIVGACLCVKRLRTACMRTDVVLLLCWIAIPLLAYSSAQTRLHWYIYPILPAVAILSASVLSIVLPLVSQYQRRLAIALVLIASITNQVTIINRLRRQEAPPTQVVLVNLARAHPTRTLVVYQDSGDWSQDDYATALLLGNVKPETGGRAAFVRHKGSWIIADGSAAENVADR